MDLVTLYVTSSSREEALSISRQLVEDRLVACANVYEGVTSVYRWESEIREEAEAVIFMKTTSALVPEATARIRSLHTYQCPCIVAWRAVGGSDDYARWVHGETRPPFPPQA